MVHPSRNLRVHPVALPLRARSPLPLLLLLTALPGGVRADDFVVQADLAGVLSPTPAWGDYDGDGDLDLLVSGGVGNPVSILYRNDGGGVFNEVPAGLLGLEGAALAWGDYDGDGDLDLLVSGYDGSNPRTRLYRNDNAAFVDIPSPLTGVSYGTADWGDYDNDGDLDFLLSGSTGSNYITRIYRNDMGGFLDIAAGLIGVVFSAADWGDYDNDGDLDILLSGLTGPTSQISRVYRNDGGGVFNDLPLGLPGYQNSQAAWGDCDGDGDLDFYLGGHSPSLGGDTSVYRNDGGDTFAKIPVFPGFGGSGCSVAWGDCDNDGDLDMLLAGPTVLGEITRLYWNTGAGIFLNSGAGFPGLTDCGLAWGDDDNDGDLDFFIAGLTPQLTLLSRVYRNDTLIGNTAPSPPANLTSVRNGDQVTFSWTGSTDDHTPTAALSYNLRVGTTLGGNEVVPGLSAASGFRRVVSLGNCRLRLSWTLTLPPGGYSWGVQAIDNAFLGSPFATGESQAPLFLEMAVGLPGLDVSSVAWGDYDNDDDLDLLLVGYDGVDAVSRLYRNDGLANFSEIPAGLQGVTQASTTWGDYDSDGDLDILLTGYTGGGRISRVYRNDGAGSFPAIADLPGVNVGSAAWGDYDNDGDLDILLTGATAAVALAGVYRNEGGGVFNDIAAGLPGVLNSSAAWGDYDNDGDLDILLTGEGSTGGISRIYRNDGSGGFQDVLAGLPGVFYSSVAWGDQDGDGDLDVLLSGLGDSGAISGVYRNDAGAFHDLGAGLPGVYFSSVGWGDYDHDGDLDALLTGYDSAANPLCRIYRNDGGGAFGDAAALLPGIALSSAAWGDYDHDGDLDILLSGSTTTGRISRIYRNETVTGNTPPAPPTNLAAIRNGDLVTFSWTGPVDDHTPMAGLSYNLRIGTSPGGDQILSAMAAGSGYRRVPRTGNAQHRTSWTITVPEANYFWGVQAVDGSLAGSPFSTASVTTGVEESGEAPSRLLLGPGIPNPFRASTGISYALPSSGPVVITIYNASGRAVRTLMDGPVESGTHTVRWDGKNEAGIRLPAGMYFLRIRTTGTSAATKLLLVG